MKGLTRISAVVVIILSMLLAGCGSGMIQLTPEEEQLIVAYASGAVSKGNRTQEQGLTYRPEEEEQSPGTTENVQEEPTPGEDDTQGETGNPDTEQSGQEPEPEVVLSNLTDAVGIPGVTAEYRGYQLQDNYMVGDYFALSANEGNTYLVINIGLNNTGTEPIECNLIDRIMQCGLLVNGEAVTQAMSTILLNDFRTYMKTLGAASTEETVLIFEVPAEAAAGIQTIAIELLVGGTNYQVTLN